jgi:hypothetical protein
MKPKIAFLDFATTNSKAEGKVIAIEFRFSVLGFSFPAVALGNGLCRIPLTRS